MHSNSTLNHLITSVEELCPLVLADRSWDNVGLMIESPLIRTIEKGLKKRIVCCIDCMYFIFFSNHSLLFSDHETFG